MLPSLPELNEEEAHGYWRDLLIVGRTLEDVLRPVKTNYNMLGNSVPHLHTHIVPRYADDPRPGWPFPFPEEEPPRCPKRNFNEISMPFELPSMRGDLAQTRTGHRDDLTREIDRWEERGR